MTSAVSLQGDLKMHKIPVFQFTTDKFLSWLNPAPLASIYLHALALTSLNPGTNFNHM